MNGCIEIELDAHRFATSVFQVAVAGAECRAFADVEATVSQLSLENEAMKLLYDAGIGVPLPMRSKQGLDVEMVQQHDAINFVRVIELAEHFVQLCAL